MDTHRDTETPQQGGLAGLIESLRERIAAARADARLRADLAHEIACLDEAGELDGALDALGLSRGAVEYLLEKYPGSARRFNAMAERLGIADRARPAAAIDALAGPRRRCLFCEEVQRCEEWIREGRRDGYREFCPNAATFDALRAAR